MSDRVVKQRLDKLLLERGLAESRERAQRLIMSGLVRVAGRRAEKPGVAVSEDAPIEVAGPDIPFVGRGGVKLAHALSEFDIDPSGRVALDVGASTGGFTDCLLQRGASRVYAVDVGYGQLAWKLRQDPRVVVIERQNVRYLAAEQVPEPIDLAVVDVSFISLKKVLPKVVEFLTPCGVLVCLIKPQFEVGRGEVGRGGVVRSAEKQRRVVAEISRFCADVSLEVIGVTQSPIPGQDGNREFLMIARNIGLSAASGGGVQVDG
ncbi:MAG TPA: TlyA family RNA methyltransferase [Nitrospiria bacterium]|nr:TlyA family RNA methyltransferase [Nitrospiria bacterium]